MTQNHAHPILPEPLPVAPAETPIPEKIGRYKIEGLLQRGGMSLLYLGIHPDTCEPIIVKVLSPKFTAQKEVVARFLNEARIIALTDHPNIIRLYDYGEWENGLYIALEFVRGTSLRHILDHQPFSLRKALEIILETAYALCHLHTHGVVHGDLKPENILITDDDHVKLIDFGIAKMLTEETNTTSHQMVGTPIYMSPEAKAGPACLTFASDIYSLGILAYELVLGKITHGRVILSLAPLGMQKILMKALQPNIEDRYPDIVDFIIDISNYMNSAEVEKDRQGSDYFFELYEKLEKFHEATLPEKVPSWAGIDIARASFHGMGLRSLYYDFFEYKDHAIIIIAEASKGGGEGVLSTSMLRATVRAIIKEEPRFNIDDFFARLSGHIREDMFGEEFGIGLLDLDMKKKQYTFREQGDKSFLLHYVDRTKKATPSGKGSVGPGDRLLLAGFALPVPLCGTFFEETTALSGQKQVDSLVRKIRLGQNNPIEEHPLIMILLGL
jgi:hypothetical protein